MLYYGGHCFCSDCEAEPPSPWGMDRANNPRAFAAADDEAEARPDAEEDLEEC